MATGTKSTELPGSNPPKIGRSKSLSPGTSKRAPLKIAGLKKVADLSGKLAASGEVTSNALSRSVILTSMRGHLDVELARRSAATFAELILQTVEPSWVVDILALSGFQPSAVKVGNSWWTTFKEHGGLEVVLVSRSAAYRMTAATLGFGSGLRVKTFESVDQALAYLGVGSRERHAK
jgi:hypothetical protein